MKTLILNLKQTSGKLTVLALLIFLSTAFSSCKKDSKDSEDMNVGSMAPSFTLQDCAGVTFKSESFKGKAQVLFFFGSGCPSCKAIGPMVESAIFQANKSRTDIMVLGLDQWDGNVAAVEAFRATTGITFPLLVNASSTASAYETIYDRIVIVDKKGIIRFKGTQVVSNDLAAAKAMLATVLAE